MSCRQPAFYGKRLRRKLKAGAACEDLRVRCPYFYDVGCLLHASGAATPDLTAFLNETFADRYKVTNNLVIVGMPWGAGYLLGRQRELMATFCEVAAHRVLSGRSSRELLSILQCVLGACQGCLFACMSQTPTAVGTAADACQCPSAEQAVDPSFQVLINITGYSDNTASNDNCNGMPCRTCWCIPWGEILGGRSCACRGACAQRKLPCLRLGAVR